MYGKHGTKSHYKMGSKLTGIGLLWAFVSFVVSALACTGFYMPFWLQGKLHNNTDVFFGTFRQCNFPRMDLETGQLKIIRECGRYTTFDDIPSLYWQIATVVVGVGAGLLVIVGLIAMIACCVTDIVTQRNAKLAGAVQLLAGLLIGAGCCIYPSGWNSHEVLSACGSSSGQYSLGDCTLGWAYYITIGTAAASVMCMCLSCHASRQKTAYED